MKILHVAASYLPATRYGGTIVSVHGLCRALAARGHDVHVYTTSVDGPDDSDVPHHTPVDIDGVHVWYFRSRAGRRIYYAPGLGAMLREHVREFAIVHTHAIYLWPLWAAAWAARRSGRPYVMSPRGMLEKELIENKNPVMKAALIGFIERPLLEGAAAIHVTSRREADEARAFGFTLPPMCEIPNGVDGYGVDDAIAPDIAAIAARGPYALFLGRINWKKGLDRLIRALPHAPDVRLVMAGNDEERYQPVLERLAGEAGVRERIIFTGPVSGSNKAFLIEQARVVVLPSYSENFGNVVLEAMIAGRAVLVTPEVGVARLVRDTHAGIVADGAPVTLGTSLMRMMSDAAGSNAMGARGREVARQQYSWDAVARCMEQTYERILAGRSPC